MQRNTLASSRKNGKKSTTRATTVNLLGQEGLVRTWWMVLSRVWGSVFDIRVVGSYWATINSAVGASVKEMPSSTNSRCHFSLFLSWRSVGRAFTRLIGDHSRFECWEIFRLQIS